MGEIVPFLLGLIVSAGLLVPLLLRMRASAAEARADAGAAGPQIQFLKRANSKLQEDLEFLTHFLKDFPRLARELHGGLSRRQIPGVLLRITQRSLDPEQVAILMRGTDKGRKVANRYVVAAAYSESAALKIGATIPLHTGEIGFASESQIVVTRQDLETDQAKSRVKLGPGLPGIPHPDLIAPLVFDQETLGVIVVSKPRKSGDPKAALGLVAQTGAQVLHTQTEFNRMRHTAEIDGLTRVYNKNHMERRLNELVYGTACAAYDQREGRKGGVTPFSVFLFDIDNFKNYNDANGHLAGDKLLVELAALVPSVVRQDDVFGRFGGEEFLLILPHTDAQQAMRTAEKVRIAIANHPFAFAERQPLKRLSVSGGVAEYPHDGLDAAGLLHTADEALYQAKKDGRNRVLPAARAQAVTAPEKGAARAHESAQL